MADSTRRLSLGEVLAIIARKQRAEGDCRVWTGMASKRKPGKTDGGYGRIRYQGKMVAVHRLVCEAARGPVPAGMQVMHSCDRPLCVNPAHLFFGTNADNIADKMRRDRSGKKLTIAKVIEIRKLARSGFTYEEIGVMYEVHSTSIGRAVSGARWGHVPLAAGG